MALLLSEEEASIRRTVNEIQAGRVPSRFAFGIAEKATRIASPAPDSPVLPAQNMSSWPRQEGGSCGRTANAENSCSSTQPDMLHASQRPASRQDAAQGIHASSQST